MLRRKRFGGYTVSGVPVKEEKNRAGQIGLAILMGAIFCVPWIARAFHWHMSAAALTAAVAIDVLLLLAVAVWALRTWDY